MSSTFPPDQSGTAYEPAASGITGDNSDSLLGDEVRQAGKRAANTAANTAAALRENLRTLKSELDTLVTRADTLTDNELNAAYVKLTSKFGSVRFTARHLANQATQQFNQVSEQAQRQFNQGVDVTKTYVQDKPLQSVAIAAGLGVAFGMLLGRR